MAEVMDSGHVVTDEDVDTARLIMELDRVLGRSSDALTKQVAETPPERVRTLLVDAAPAPTSVGTNGRDVAAAEDLVATLTSEENAAELAREVGQELATDLDPVEQERVVSRIKDVIRRRMIKLVTETGSGH